MLPVYLDTVKGHLRQMLLHAERVTKYLKFRRAVGQFLGLLCYHTSQR